MQKLTVKISNSYILYEAKQSMSLLYVLPQKVMTYLIFLNLCPERVELLQPQFSTPIILVGVKVISLEVRKGVFPLCAGLINTSACDLTAFFEKY